jgi:hypothetical protein
MPGRRCYPQGIDIKRKHLILLFPMLTYPEILCNRVQGHRDTRIGGAEITPF